MRVVARARQNFLDFALLIRHDVGLGGFKFHGTARFACLELNLVERVQIFDVRRNGFVRLGQHTRAFGNVFPHLRVGQPRG